MSTDATAYWQARAEKFGGVAAGLPAVCSYGMPRLYNAAIHACQRRALAPWLDQRAELDVLEVGCGVGRWSVPLARRGHRVVGVDLSPRMVELAAANARRQQADAKFLVGDVSSFDLGTQFDLVLVVTVLQHVIDDGALERAVRNLARHLRPSGTLVLLEVAPTYPSARCDSATFKSRPLSRYTQLLENAGLNLSAVGGVDIAPLRKVMLPLARALPGRISRAAGTLCALLSLPIDLWSSRHFPDRCWHKVMIARRSA